MSAAGPGVRTAARPPPPRAPTGARGRPRRPPLPSGVAVVGLHHVAIIVSDLESSLRFYTAALGGVVVRRTFRAQRGSHKVDVELAGGAGGFMLEVFTFPGPPPPPPRPTRPEALGLRHLALAVTGLDGELARLAALGIAAEPVRTDALTGQRFTFITDPDGTPIELYEVGAPGPAHHA